MTRLIAYALWMSVSVLASAEEKIFRYSCDGAEVEIRGTYDANDPGCLAFKKFDMSVYRSDRRVYLDLSYGYMSAACLTNVKGKKLIVFQQYCDGTACNDGANYGIVDPRDLTILLVPDSTSHRTQLKNRRTAAKILGVREPPYLGDNPATVCCSYCDD